MDFGYFTLSDNHYENNPRSANQFVADITAEALYADKLGMHSAWIGEHHFNSLGVLSCPDMVLAYVAAQYEAHPPRAGGHGAAAASSDPRRRAMGDARSAQRRPRRFRRRARLRPARIRAVPCVIRRQPGYLRGRAGARAPALGGGGDRISHHGKYYPFDDVRITPKPIQRPMPTYVGSFSKPSIELAARLGCGLIVAPFAAAHELRRPQAGRRSLSRELRQARQEARPADVQLLHAFRRQQGAGRRAARAADPLLQGMRDPGASPAIPRPRRRAIATSSTWSSGCSKVKPEDLTENSVLLGSPARITDTLEEGRGRRLRRSDPLLQRRPKAARQVKDEMARFMAEVAPVFAGAPKVTAA